jgi:hypothetical protein
MAELEIAANPDPKRRTRVKLLLPEDENIAMLTQSNPLDWLQEMEHAHDAG